MILHQVESLAAAGVTDIVLAVNYRPDVMVSTLKKVRSNYSYPSYAYVNMSFFFHGLVRGTIQRQH